MGRTLKTHLFIYDERKLFTGEIARKFDDPARYEISSFHVGDEFIRSVCMKQDRRSCVIAILGTGEAAEHAVSMVEKLKSARHIKGIILLCPPDKTDEIRKSASVAIETCIPQNSNSVLRLHNLVKKIFSEHTINIYRIRRNRSAAVLGIFLLLAALLFLGAMARLPQYF